jgi:16S rRNA (cytidine1402-2'-O)-methyltransferase
MQTPPGKLYLIPTPLHPEALDTIPEAVKTLTLSLRYFVVETEKVARRFLLALHKSRPHLPWNFEEVQLQCPNWKAAPLSFSALQTLLEPALEGYDMGLLSDCGAPAIADPGSSLVHAAHRLQITVAPLAGPSSLLLALMASGLNAQNFQFNGYLPQQPEQRKKKILHLERQIYQSGQTQLFIETPYRNQVLFKDLISYCLPQTLLCIALNLHSGSELIRTMSIEQWQNEKVAFAKAPAIFLLGLSTFE